MRRTVIREEPVTPVEVELAITAPALLDTAPVPPFVTAVKKKRRTTIGTVAAIAAIAPSKDVRMDSQRLAQNIIFEHPLSPRTLLRQAGETIYALQNQRDSARREYWAQQIAKSLR